MTELKVGQTYRVASEEKTEIGLVRFEWYRPVTDKFLSSIAGWLDQTTSIELSANEEIEFDNLELIDIETNEKRIVEKSFIMVDQHRLLISCVHD